MPLSQYEQQQEFAQAMGYPSYAAYLEQTGAAPWSAGAVTVTGEPTRQALDMGGTPVGYTPSTHAWGEQPVIQALNSLAVGEEPSKAVATLIEGLGETGGGGGALGFPAAGGVGLAGLLGIGGVGAGVLGGLGVLLSRIKFPWQTPAGEGFIAPWTEQQLLPSGLWGQEGEQYAPPVSAAPAIGAGALGGVYIVKQWTNASKDGRSPATVAFAKLSNGKMASLNLLTGETKQWRPKKHIVISKDPRMSHIMKVERTYMRMVRRLAKKSKLLKLQ